GLVYQRLPSAPATMSVGSFVDDGPAGSAKVVMTPAGVMRPIRSVSGSVNHRLPSGPAVIEERSSIVAPGSAKVVIGAGTVTAPAGGAATTTASGAVRSTRAETARRRRMGPSSGNPSPRASVALRRPREGASGSRF